MKSNSSHRERGPGVAPDQSVSGTLLALNLSHVVLALPELGLDADAVLARARLSREALCGPPDARVPASWEHRLWEAIEAVAGDCGIGLRLAARFLNAGMPNLDGYLARNAPTLRAVLVDMDRFAAISDDRMRMVLSERGDTATIRMLRAVDRAHGYVEAHFAVMVGFAHQFVGAVPLWSVHLRRPRPRNLTPYRNAFAGVTPDFGKPHNEMHFQRAGLEQPVRGAEPGLAEILEAHAKQLVASVPSDDPFIRRVRDSLKLDISEGRSGLARLTNALALSERTLRRQLLARETSYQALVDEVRCELACALLAADEPVNAVAERVGFRSTSAFQKAFARWMKVSPSRYRRTRIHQDA